MKILLAALQSDHAYPLPAYRFWAGYFRRGLEERGDTVIEVAGADWARGMLPLTAAERTAWRAEVWARTIATVKAERPDVFLGYFFPAQIERAAVAEIKRFGVPCVHFFCDNVREFQRLPDEFAEFDLHWVPEVNALPLYATRGWRHVYAPMPAWVPPDLRTPDAEERHPATFLGSRDLLRAAVLRDALALGAEVEIRGHGWNQPPQDTLESPAAAPATLGVKLGRQLALARRDGWRAPWHKWGYRQAERRLDERPILAHVRRAPPENEGFLGVLRGAEVAIGINRFPSFRAPFARPPTYSRLRDIEAPMAGACYLAEWTPDLPHLYEVEKEVATWRTVEELVGQLKQLHDHPTLRRELRRRGQRRALQEHTVPHSFDRIVGALGLA